MSAFLGKPVAEADIPGLADFLSFDNMKKNPAMNKQSFVDVSGGQMTGSFLACSPKAASHSIMRQVPLEHEVNIAINGPFLVKVANQERAIQC